MNRKCFVLLLLVACGTVMTHSHKHALKGLPKRSAIVETIPIWHKQWRVTFDLKPLKKMPCWTNIIHFTTSGDSGKNGFRIPGVWFIAYTFSMEIRNSVNNADFVHYMKRDLPTNETSSVRLQQIQENAQQGKFFFKIFVNNKLIRSVENKHPAEYRNVKVYKSDPWYSPANAIIDNFNYMSIPHFPTVDLLQQNVSVDTMPKWYKQWRVTFDIKPLKKTTGYTNIIHFTTGGNGCKNGRKIPAISFLPNSFRLYIMQYNEHGFFGYYQKTNLPAYKFSSVRVEQIRRQGKFYFLVYINNKLVYWKINKYPAVYDNVKVYKTNPWDNSANAIVKNFNYMSSNEPVLKKNVLVATIPVWKKQWIISFKIKPLEKMNTLSNILHFTTGGNCCENGQRIPGVWFLPNSYKVLVSSSVNSNGNMLFKSKELAFYQFTPIRIKHSRECDGKYHYEIYIDGELAFSMEDKYPRVYNNVKVYTSDPWYKAANCALTEFSYVTMP